MASLTSILYFLGDLHMNDGTHIFLLAGFSIIIVAALVGWAIVKYAEKKQDK